jgi:beta-barrel assembly-enhancing protease
VSDAAALRYFDGRTATAHDATLHIDGDVLIIGAADGEHARWPLRKVRHGAPDPDGVVALSCRGEAGRVLAHRRALPSALRGRDGKGARAVWMSLAALTFGLLIVCIAVLRDPARLSAFVPHAAEARLGDFAETSLTDSSRACDGVAGQQALERLEARIGRAAGLDAPVRIVVLDKPLANAFALPDSRMILMRGLIAQAGDANQLAGVMAHETGHIANRDPLNGLIRQWGIGAIAASFGVQLGVGDLSSMAGRLVGMSYTRDVERAADAHGIAYLRASGLRSDGLAAFFHSMRKQSIDGGLPRFLSDHPPTPEREAMNAGSPTGDDAMSPAEWRAVQSMCGPAPRRK